MYWQLGLGLLFTFGVHAQAKSLNSAKLQKTMLSHLSLGPKEALIWQLERTVAKLKSGTHRVAEKSGPWADIKAESEFARGITLLSARDREIETFSNEM